MANDLLLLDADVLIDYVNSDLGILSLVSEHVGPVRVIRHVLETVTGLTKTACSKHKIGMIEVETPMLVEAGRQSGPLSFEDWLCYLFCKEEKWVCVTNDRALRRECDRGKVLSRRGLGLMVDLV